MKSPVKYDRLRDGDRLWRVLWCDPCAPRLVVLDVTSPSGWPIFRELADILDDLEGQALTYEPFEDPRDLRLDAEIDPRHILRRDAAWALIGSLVSDEPAVYMKAQRCERLHIIEAENDIRWNALVQYVQRYWRGGMTKNALLPRFSACGAPGRRRADTPVRRGRPRRAGHPIGLNTTLEHRRLFNLAMRQYYAKNRKLSLNGAYETCIRLYFTEIEFDQNGRIEHIPKPEFTECGFPTFGSFKYWVKDDRSILNLERKRQTPRVYDMKHRSLTGSTTHGAWGPGARYQIDATIADVYLVSSCDSNQLIGRPVVYVIIDEFSRMITGLYIGLEGPSFMAAAMAIANAAAPKPAFCAQFGISIEDDDWPAHHLPAAILADRGELVGPAIENALETFGVRIENTPPYRGDWKGLIESQFRTMHGKFKPYVPGYIECDFRQRGARDYRGDAVLNLKEFSTIIIDMILVYNQTHVLKDYERHPGLTEDGVPSIPIELWRWGIANMSGRLQSPSPEDVRFALMPTKEALVTEHGIYFQKMYYTCDTAVKERWFEKARLKRFKKLISYDKRDATRIYVHTPGGHGRFEIALLAPKSRQYDGLSGWEADALQQATARLHAAVEMGEQLKRAALISRMEATVAQAKDRADAARSPTSLAQKTRDVRPNRAAEKAVRRTAEAAAFRPDTVPQQSEDVVPFSKSDTSARRYAKPGLTSLKKQIEAEDE